MEWAIFCLYSNVPDHGLLLRKHSGTSQNPHTYWVPIRDTDELRKHLIATRHGLNFIRAWWTMQLISGEKDWKHVSMQKVVTLNICCNVACLTFHLPHVTIGSFQSHHRLEDCNISSVRWKSCAFYKVVWWHFSGVVDKGITVCFLFFWDNENNLK